MDIISFNEASTANGRIENFIENPDSTSGVLTVPKTIASGETVTIPAGRVAVLPNVQVDGTLNVEGEVFIPSGATFGDLESQIALKADTSYVNNKYSGFKNYIINGGFDVWQRGAAQESSIDGLNAYGSDDRWVNQYTATYRKHTRQLTTDIEKALFNSAYFSRTVTTTAGTSVSLVLKKQNIEDVTRLAGKTVTLSFWAKADSNKNIAMEVVQGFGTGGSPSALLDKQNVTTIGLTPTWQKKTITFTIPSIAGKTIGTDGVHTSYTQIRLWFDAGTDFKLNTNSLGSQSGTFDIAQVQLEEGSVATPFESRPYGLELSLCQRYFDRRKLVVFAPVITGIFGGSVPVNIEGNFRVSPSFSVNSVLGNYNWVGSLVCSNNNLGSIVFSSAQQTTVGAYIDAICDFSAEL